MKTVIAIMKKINVEEEENKHRRRKQEGKITLSVLARFM